MSTDLNHADNERGKYLVGKKEYTISSSEKVLFNNHVDYCIGTGRMGLALRREYFEQLKLVQEKIGFKYIRGHGLFAEDMAIYQEYEEKAEYNFTYLDMVMDNYLELGLKPFLELGFMPEKMASGTQTIFYWRGNVTPPRDYTAWTNMVVATLTHLMKCYGADEVTGWPIEVWNEPNLSVFWKDADMNEYFRLFEETFTAIKGLDKRFRIGGPSICGVDDERWMNEFLLFCRDKSLALDFVTRHHYVSEPPEQDGHYMYVELRPPEECMESLCKTRQIVDSFEEFRNLDIHITEFSTAYVPRAPLHDTNYNAAYIAFMLSKLGDVNESYSYWTFGDIFEEQGVPFTPFHGGFGLVANGCIPKPTFWTFEFFKRLKGKCIHREDDSVIVIDERGKYRGVAWNLQEEDTTINFSLSDSKGKYCFIKKIVDEEHCNPLKLWHNMGEPSSLSKEEMQILRDSANPYISSEELCAENGILQIQIILKKYAVVYFEIFKVNTVSDRGYSYEKAISKMN